MLEITINRFHNVNTLNIFSDASICGKSGNFFGCYGAIAVVQDTIIDQTYRLVSDTTNNNSEIKGIRAALDLALKYSNSYKYINIFSDSLTSINGLKSYIYGWEINKEDGLLYNKTNKLVSNQAIFVESFRMLHELKKAPSIIRLWHQAGHIDNGFNSIIKGANVFRKSNSIVGNIDLNFIRYISAWNNHVDNNSRSMLRRNIKNDNNYHDGLIFTTEFGSLL